jgi:hypothetical protein
MTAPEPNVTQEDRDESRPREASGPGAWVHPFQAESGVTNWRGDPLCGQFGCGQPADHPRHRLPDTDPDMTAAERRRTGGDGIIRYGSEAEARVAAGTAAEMLPPVPTEPDAAGLDLDALTALEAAATRGPWYRAKNHSRARVDDPDNAIGAFDGPHTRYIAVVGDGGDAELVCAARNALPALIAEVQELRAEVEQAWAALAGYDLEAFERQAAELEELRAAVQELAGAMRVMEARHPRCGAVAWTRMVLDDLPTPLRPPGMDLVPHPEDDLDDGKATIAALTRENKRLTDDLHRVVAERDDALQALTDLHRPACQLGGQDHAADGS